MFSLSTLIKPRPISTDPFTKKAIATKRKRIFILSLLGVVVVGVFIWIIWLGSLGGILILEPNNNFSVTLNGNRAQLVTKSNGIFIHTSPGLYKLELSKPGFAPFDANVNIGRGQTVTIRPIYSVLPKEVQEAGGSIAFVRESADQKRVFYLGNNRQTIYQVTIATQQQIPITLDQLSGVQDVEWSSAPNLALIVEGDGIYLQEIPVYDFTSQIKTKIAGPEVGSPVWDPNDPNRIAFTYTPGNGEHSLVFSDIHISYIDRKADISSLPNPKLTWAPSSNYILLLPQSDNPAQQDLWEFSTVDGSMSQLSQGGSVSGVTISPDSGTIIYEQNGDLKSVSPSGTNTHDLGFHNQTSQVAWSTSSSFYLPNNTTNILSLVNLNGTEQSIPFSFPSTAIQGMSYATSDHTLIFYTDSSIYLADLSK